MDNQELDQWVDRLIAGDEAAFDHVYQLTRTKLYGTVASLVHNREDVNDIVSEIYYQLWRALPSYDRKRPFLFWLNGLVIKQVSNWRRQVWRRFRLLEKRTRLHEEPDASLPGDALMVTETQRDMQQAISRLPFKLRTVILYRFYYEYTYEQIAELLQIPVGTVKSRNHLAIKQLRKWVDLKQVEEGLCEHVHREENKRVASEPN
ncbi:sigma-70 family RNA polymerase sigma factor [Brevibacillus fluminis]|uniref:Sigma-70 family RNA polymerase sigma factor n=1 Tax=Brevibacillus fluminis TaxID=511487 RepID=A0A3M8DK89_9BACL|nr:sigma-70 family RNA polymerase sigma factor [Brevibacillus fluminis]RNB87881.1 sigma-70 family RNA polymerase sigma factor [Brevibacillus fluminis]